MKNRIILLFLILTSLLSIFITGCGSNQKLDKKNNTSETAFPAGKSGASGGSGRDEEIDAKAPQEKAYEEALALLSEEKYREALDVLTDLSLNDYKDSGELAQKAREEFLLKSKYDDAMALLDGGDYEQARKLFIELREYRDSRDKVLEITEHELNSAYTDADELFQDRQYDEAKDIFERLAIEKYSDSEQRLAETLHYIDYMSVVSAYDDGGGIKSGLSPQKYRDFYDELDNFTDIPECLDMKSAIDEALWQEGLNDLNYMRGYYSLFPDSERASEAESIYKEKAIAIAQEKLDSAATIRDLQSFVDEWVDEPILDEFTNLAEVKIGELANDSGVSAPILKDPNNATDEMINDFLSDFPGHKDEEKIKNLFVGDYTDLIKSGMISVKISGNSIDYTSVIISNNSKRSVTVTIPIGAYFASNSSSVQNMAVRRPETVTIKSGSEKSVSIATACMNIRRAIPSDNNSFKASVITNNPKLVRVMKLLDEENASYAVAQAAVWYVTDNPGDNALLNTLVYSNGTKAISKDDLATAKDIVRRAG